MLKGEIYVYSCYDIHNQMHITRGKDTLFNREFKLTKPYYLSKYIKYPYLS